MIIPFPECCAKLANMFLIMDSPESQHLRNVNTAERYISGRKNRKDSVLSSVKIDGGIVNGLRKENICIRIVKITLMENGEHE